MATHLKQLLQCLCWHTEWSYAVFWKLKDPARMVLTWEDVHCNHFIHEPANSRSFSNELETWHGSDFAYDPLSLAVSKMSNRVYSHGEGVVGQVAVTGKYRWIFAGDHSLNSCPSPEFYNEWQAQFSAGIKTVVVAAVVPLGVVQLGSLSKVNEDPKLLTHIRDLFSSLQDASACHVQIPIQHASSLVIPSPCEGNNCSYLTFSCGIELSEVVSLMGDNELPEVIDNANLIQAVSGHHQLNNLLTDANSRSNVYRIETARKNAGQQPCDSSQICLMDIGTYANKNFSEKLKLFPADNLETAACYTDVFDGEGLPSEEKLSKLGNSDSLSKQNVENNAEILPHFNYLDNINSSFMFSADSELHEALGPVFVRGCYPWSCEVENSDDRSMSDIPKFMESSMLTSDSGSDHLLEAVVANFCHQDTSVKKKVSFSTSESILTTEKNPEPSIDTRHQVKSSCYSLGGTSLLHGGMKNCLNSSDSCGVRSSTSACREPPVRPIELGKANKKRARPENSRPRPRDRQLIQDRIRELRELVPSGSKCSIDSLLERTIKHMVFLQSVTKHADKLTNCTNSRDGSNETGMPRSGYEQGSSWAVEVGGEMKMCPVVVKNFDMNGQMLIEMLSEDCDHFLEIAEVIKSLGLTILKGVTDYGDKTWMRFVVEAHSNRTLHRMDVLWSLIQILQSKAIV